MINLIYFTIGNNFQYINLLELCIKSLHKQNYIGDILLITNNIYKNIIQQHISWPIEKTHFLILDEQTNLITSAGNKLKIYQFELINKYTNILYCDVDVLWTNTPNNIFDLIVDNKIYISNDDKNHNMSHRYWGGEILNDQEKTFIENNRIIGLNTGLFAFSISMINDIFNIDQFFTTNINLVNECLEQPFINAYLYRNRLYDLISDELVSHNGYHYNDKFDGTVLHFAGGPGNYDYKLEKMLNYYKKYLLQ
jgi:hypothetical protein